MKNCFKQRIHEYSFEYQNYVNWISKKINIYRFLFFLSNQNFYHWFRCLIMNFRTKSHDSQWEMVVAVPVFWIGVRPLFKICLNPGGIQILSENSRIVGLSSTVSHYLPWPTGQKEWSWISYGYSTSKVKHSY